MTMVVTRIMTSPMPLKKSVTTFTRSPQMLREKPSSTAKKMIWSMLPLARLSMGLMGTMLRSTWVRLAVERSRPMPGWKRLASTRPMKMAMAVVAK